MKRKNKRQKEDGLLLPDYEFKVVKKDRRVYLDKNGKIKQDINYTLVPNEKKKTSKVKVIILTFALALFCFGGFFFMSYAYKYDLWVSVFEFADNYLFLGAITLFIFLVFKSKKWYYYIGKDWCTMQDMNIREKQGFKSFCDVMFVLLCIAIFVGVIAVGFWLAHTYFGMNL